MLELIITINQCLLIFISFKNIYKLLIKFSYIKIFISFFLIYFLLEDMTFFYILYLILLFKIL